MEVITMIDGDTGDGGSNNNDDDGDDDTKPKFFEHLLMKSVSNAGHRIVVNRET